MFKLLGKLIPYLLVYLKYLKSFKGVFLPFVLVKITEYLISFIIKAEKVSFIKMIKYIYYFLSAVQFVIALILIFKFSDYDIPLFNLALEISKYLIPAIVTDIIYEMFKNLEIDLKQIFKRFINWVYSSENGIEVKGAKIKDKIKHTIPQGIDPFQYVLNPEDQEYVDEYMERTKGGISWKTVAFFVFLAIGVSYYMYPDLYHGIYQGIKDSLFPGKGGGGGNTGGTTSTTTANTSNGQDSITLTNPITTQTVFSHLDQCKMENGYMLYNIADAAKYGQDYVASEPIGTYVPKLINKINEIVCDPLLTQETKIKRIAFFFKHAENTYKELNVEECIHISNVFTNASRNLGHFTYNKFSIFPIDEGFVVPLDLPAMDSYPNSPISNSPSTPQAIEEISRLVPTTPRSVTPTPENPSGIFSPAKAPLTPIGNIEINISNPDLISNNPYNNSNPVWNVFGPKSESVSPAIAEQPLANTPVTRSNPISDIRLHSRTVSGTVVPTPENLGEQLNRKLEGIEWAKKVD